MVTVRFKLPRNLKREEGLVDLPLSSSTMVTKLPPEAVRRAFGSVFCGPCGKDASPVEENILAARAFQDLFSPMDFIRGIAMDGKQNSTFLQTSFVALRFVLWYSQS